LSWTEPNLHALVHETDRFGARELDFFLKSNVCGDGRCRCGNREKCLSGRERVARHLPGTLRTLPDVLCLDVSTIAVLFVAGAAFELAGIALVGWDVRDAARTVKDMSRSDWGYDQPEDQRSRSLFAVMADVAAGNLRRRAVGVGLIACGLIVQTVANVAAL
jgi:hypothetical protein